jgi:hypothetical protein
MSYAVSAVEHALTAFNSLLEHPVAVSLTGTTSTQCMEISVERPRLSSPSAFFQLSCGSCLPLSASSGLESESAPHEELRKPTTTVAEVLGSAAEFKSNQLKSYSSVGLSMTADQTRHTQV